MRTPAQRFTPYAVKFRQVCGAIAAYAPSDETRNLHAVARALESATRAGATRMAGRLAPVARTALAEMSRDSHPDEVVSAGIEDALEALNRLTNMIRCSDPDPVAMP